MQSQELAIVKGSVLNNMLRQKVLQTEREHTIQHELFIRSQTDYQLALEKEILGRIKSQNGLEIREGNTNVAMFARRSDSMSSPCAAPSCKRHIGGVR